MKCDGTRLGVHRAHRALQRMDAGNCSVHLEYSVVMKQLLDSPCPTCRSVVSWKPWMVIDNYVIASCQECGHDNHFKPKVSIGIHRFVYLDQNILSLMAKDNDSTWKEICQKCQRLAHSQFWIFPFSETHLRELSASSDRALALRDYKLAEELCQARYLKEYSELVASACRSAFRFFLDPQVMPQIHRSEGYEWPGIPPRPLKVWTKPILALDKAFDKYRSSLKTTASATRLYEKLLLSDWPEKFISRDQSLANELQKHQELLQDSMLRVLNARQRNEVPKPGEDEDATFFKCALVLIEEAEAARVGIERALDFLLAERFKNLRWVRLRALFYAYLQEAAHAGKLKARSVKDWAHKQRNDLTDVLYIASCSPYVTDIFVDRRFYDLVKKPELSELIETRCIWTAKLKSEFLGVVDDALKSKEFKAQEYLIKAVYSSPKFKELT